MKLELNLAPRQHAALLRVVRDRRDQLRKELDVEWSSDKAREFLDLGVPEQQLESIVAIQEAEGFEQPN